MPSSESIEHKKIKEIVCERLKEWTGATIQEYQSSGHALDVFAATGQGITICVEIIWSSSRTNFFRDLSLVQSSMANVKIVIVSPMVLNNVEFQREFQKVAISQRRLNIAMHGDFIDGEKILNDSSYTEKVLRQCVEKLLLRVKVRGKTIGDQTRFEPPQPRVPDKIHETLYANLFPVVSYPKEVFVSSTFIRQRSSLYKRLGGKISSYAFLPKGGKLYTFDDVRDQDSPFRSVISNDQISVENTKDWIVNGDRNVDLISLLNHALREYCRTRGLDYDRRHDRFVCSLREGESRVFTWRRGRSGRRSSREMAKLMKGRDGRVLFGKHYAAGLRFFLFDECLFLRIAPTMTFTSDGYTPIRSKKLASLMSRYLSKQYNSAYLDLVRFWGKFLSKRDIVISIPTGGSPIEIDSSPASIGVDVGIAREVVV